MPLHGPAGYAASLIATQNLCAILELAHTDSCNEAVQVVNQTIPNFATGQAVPGSCAAHPPTTTVVPSQAQLVAPAPRQETYRANLQLLQRRGFMPRLPKLWACTLPPLFSEWCLRPRLPLADADGATVFEGSWLPEPRRQASSQRLRNPTCAHPDWKPPAPAGVWVGCWACAFGLVVTSGLRRRFPPPHTPTR